MTVYHVNKKGNDSNFGTDEYPFLTINHAAQIARHGDTVMIHKGIYREQVNPKNGGIDEKQRIVFQAFQNEKVEIKGSEVIENWYQVNSNIWKAEIANTLFGDYNPFQVELFGDWLEKGNGCLAGDLYVNGESFYEAHNYHELMNNSTRKIVVDYTTDVQLNDPHSEKTMYKWYAEVSKDLTTIYANFQDIDPNNQLVEISVRESCFYPKQTGIDYITVSGFDISQSATPWAPPTAEQVGMVGPHWSKGWQIINNHIHDTKCCAISIGCPSLPDDNAYYRLHDKPGYQYQLERVFNAQKFGWNKQKVGCHKISGNQIYNCGQCGIVGNLGGIYTEISENEIFEIGTKYEFLGWEIAAIKLHAAIDTTMIHNKIHDCTLGTWLDWEAQGMSVQQNTYFNNVRDLLIEMCHGPLLVHHNIFGSKRSIDNYSQGVAFVNNLIAGETNSQSILNRATPYHFAHDTLIKGYAMNYGGDNRFYNNIFIQRDTDHKNGTSMYNYSPTSKKDYISEIESRLPGDVELFETVRQPNFINRNIYLQGASHFLNEQIFLEDKKFDAKFYISKDESSIQLSFELPEGFTNLLGSTITTGDLGKPRIVNECYENSNGSNINLNKDYFDKSSDNQGFIGPFYHLKKGVNKFTIG